MVDPQWRLSVDAARCIGSGTCAGTAPEWFTLVDGVSTPVSDHADPDDTITDAAELCPVMAISVHDADDRLIAPEPP
jgi:ferredoxin